MTDCPVCYDKFTVLLRKPVKCPYCEFTVCTVCCKKYITDGTLDAHCMQCKRGWNDEFLDLNFTKAFRTGPYKKHREDILFDRELSLLPTRQDRVIATLKLRAISDNRGKVYKELEEVERGRTTILNKLARLGVESARYSAESLGREAPAWTLAADEKGKGKEERAKFIMKCPATDCRGFLSTAYKCGTCQLWACPDCLVMKGAEKDTEHTCDPGQKESVALIIKESRPCPKCGERISKVDGCDQMFCVDCHTSFSWMSGKVVTGVIHNPHYYEYMRKIGNGEMPRNLGDVPCGGIPYYASITNALNKCTPVIVRIFVTIHRITAEIADQRTAQYQGNFHMNDNGDLGVNYLLKEITKDAMKVELAKRETKRNKHIAIRAVLEMFVTTSTIFLNDLCNQTPKYTNDTIKEKITEFENLRTYVNDSLMTVSKMKNCSVPQIDDQWRWSPYNKVAAKLKFATPDLPVTERNPLTVFPTAPLPN